MPMPDATEILQAARRREGAIRDDLRALVEIPTGPGGVAGLEAARSWVARRLVGLGAEIRLVPGDPRPGWIERHEPGADDPTPAGSNGPPTLIARRWRGDGPRVLLGGHLDTVHPALGPFQGLRELPGDRATGPGAADMKGGIVLAIHALEMLEELGVVASWGFLANSDEETGSFHSDAAIREEAGAGYAAGFIMEPALPDGSLVTHRPGSGQFRIDVRGVAAHVGRDFAKGASAVSALARAIVAADGLCDPAAGRLVNIGPLAGGRATNIIPDRARAWGNVRYVDEAARLVLERGLEGLECGGPDQPLHVTVRRAYNRPAKPRTPGVEVLIERAQRAASELGLALPLGATGGVCDGNNMQSAGLPTIDTLGVIGGGLHREDEWVDLASLAPRAALLATLLARSAVVA